MLHDALDVGDDDELQEARSRSVRRQACEQ